jgi:serine protease AprX
MKRRALTKFLILSLLLFSVPLRPAVSGAAPNVKSQAIGKISPILLNSLTAQSSGLINRVIILTDGPPSFLLKTTIYLLGGTILREFNILYGLVALVPLSSLLQLISINGVISITPDRPMTPLMDLSRETVGANQAQQSFGLDGSGIGIAVVDSGINGDHEDLVSVPPGSYYPKSRVVYSQNFVSGESTTRDLYGHGTHVAGIIAGDGSASSGSSSFRTIKGVAPGAKLINLRVLNAQGSGFESDVIAGIERAIQLKSTYNIRIINLSIGTGVDESYNKDPLCKIAKIAWEKDMVVVVAAGNYGNTEYGPYGLITSPGNSPYVITVGATNSYGTAELTDDTITTYSSRGPTLFDHIVKPDLVAPGNRIKSLIASNSTLALDPRFAANHVSPSYYLTDSSNQQVKYFTLSGTSMAAPTVAGAAALILQRYPTINNHTVKLRLMASAKKIFSQRYDLFTVGAGLLDIPAALQNTGIAGSSRSPKAVRTGDGQIQLEFDDDWASQQDWGMGVVWGGNIILSNGVVWGGNVVWDNGVVWGGSSPFNDPGSSIYNEATQSEIAASGD